MKSTLKNILLLVLLITSVSSFGLTTTFKGEELRINLVGQSSVLFSNEDGSKETKSAAMYKGLPFNAPVKIEDYAWVLRVDEAYSFKNKITIDVQDTDGVVIRPENDSIVRVRQKISGGSMIMHPLTRAINVVWKFKSIGQQFVTTEYTYTVKMEGATVSFTKDGVITKGFNKEPRPGFVRYIRKLIKYLEDDDADIRKEASQRLKILSGTELGIDEWHLIKPKHFSEAEAIN